MPYAGNMSNGNLFVYSQKISIPTAHCLHSHYTTLALHLHYALCMIYDTKQCMEFDNWYLVYYVIQNMIQNMIQYINELEFIEYMMYKKI